MQQRGWMDKAEFIAMLHTGHQELAKHKENVNALNVFPVPDGDTGTNMLLSFSSGMEQVACLPEGTPLEQVVSAFSAGLLMGARGNSGVILSQLFRGFQLAFGKTERIDARLFALALQSGVHTAYKAVSRPVEGTILTVAREAAQAGEAAAKKQEATLYSVVSAILKRAEQVLAKTPDLLPVLRQAGVVDSGGQGLVYIYRGFLSAMAGADDHKKMDERFSLESSDVLGSPVYSASEVHGEGEFGYCTEFLIQLEPEKRSDGTEQLIRAQMEIHGDSLLVVQADELIKVHVHTLHPGAALESALTFGPLLRIKIDNMTAQHQTITQQIKKGKTTSAKVCGLVVVAAGQGLLDLFHELSADQVVPGGQTMNPSTEDLLEAAKQVSADHVILLPNNRNIVMAAEQASAVSDGRIHVVETHSVGQGLAAALVYHPEQSIETNDQAMKEAIQHIMSGSVTTSVRDSKIGEHVIGEGDYIGIFEGDITCVDHSRQTVLVKMIEHFCSRGAEICTVFYRDPIFVSEVQIAFADLRVKFPHVEFEHQYGGQPLYDYLFAAE